MASDESIPSRIVRSSGSKLGMVRRRFPRFPVELPCLYSLDNGPDWSGTAIDLSRGGCAIRSMTPVQKGDYLKVLIKVLIFPSTDQAPIEVGLAPVRWVTTEEFGVEFITLFPHDAKRLQSYLTLIESDSPDVE